MSLSCTLSKTVIIFVLVHVNKILGFGFFVQEEFEADDEVGRLKCDHLYHFECIQKWVAHKNFCPVCKEQVAARH